MTILFVLENYYPNIGGVETLFKSLAEQLSSTGHKVIILTTQLSKEDPRKEQIENITILRFPFRNRYFFTFLAVFPILKIISQCDLVHTTSYNAALPAFFAAKLRRKKVIITFHEVWGQLWYKLPYMSKFGQRLHYAFEQMLLKFRFDKFIAVSESTAHNLIAGGVDEKRVIVNYNGIDYQDFRRENYIKEANKHPFVFTFFGRLGMSKGINFLLEAACILKKEMPNARLQMIIPTTPIPFYQEIMEYIKTHDLTDFIILKNELSQKDLHQSLINSDCVVIPSYSEGFCFAAVETIALEVPIISSDQQALREVVSGKFIKMKNLTTEALIEAIRQAKKGNWEENEPIKFELKDTVERYISLYEEVLSIKYETS